MKNNLDFCKIPEETCLRLRAIRDEIRSIRANLEKIRKKPFWEDSVPYIHELNQKLFSLESEFDLIIDNYL